MFALTAIPAFVPACNVRAPLAVIVLPVPTVMLPLEPAVSVNEILHPSMPRLLSLPPNPLYTHCLSYWPIDSLHSLPTLLVSRLLLSHRSLTPNYSPTVTKPPAVCVIVPDPLADTVVVPPPYTLPLSTMAPLFVSVCNVTAPLGSCYRAGLR